MKALSVRPPWSWAIIYAGKRFENREWATNYRGTLLIHASKKFDHDALDVFDLFRVDYSHVQNLDSWRGGGIIGMVDLIDCLRVDDELLELDYFEGQEWISPTSKYAWQLDNPRPLPFKAYRGQLGLWECEFERIRP